MRKELNITSNIWINANAGSGKTTILIKRILALILNGTKQQNIVAITYTNAGANEIKKRFFDTILRWKNLDESSLLNELIEIVENPNVEIAKNLFDRIILSGIDISIYTIHSFCYKLLQDIANNSNNEFEVLEIKNDIANGEILDELIIKTSDFIYDLVLNSNEIEREIADYFLLNIGSSEIKEFIINILNEDEFTNKPVLNIKTIKNLTNSVYQKIKFYDLINIANAMYPLNSHVKKRAEKIIQWLKFDEADRIEYIDLLCEGFLTSDKAGKNYINLDEFDIVSNILAEFIFEKNNLIVYNFSFILPKIANFIKNKYFELKNAYKIWDYNDVLDNTIKIIKNDKNLWFLYKMSYKIEHFLLDEAQDTNEKSWDIIEILTEDFFVGESASSVLRTIFIVGDEKQSIFSFQGANFDLFEAKKQLFEQKSISAKIPFFVINLNTSYRSNSVIIDFINNFCKDENIKNCITKSDSAEHLVCEKMKNISGDIEIIEIEKKAKEKNNDILDLTDSNSIQNNIEYLEETKNAILGLKNKGFANKDIMILMRKRSAKNNIMFNLFNYLSNYDIKVGSIDKINIFEHILFYDFLSLLKFFNNKDDDLNLACFLGSIFCNLSFNKIDELCKERLKNNINLYDQLLLSKEFIAENILFQGLNKTILEINIPLITSIYGSIGEQIISILIDKVTSIEYAGLSLIQIIDKISHLKENISQKDDYEEDCVRLSTVHSSKGLESKAIILIDVVDSLNKDNRFKKTDLLKFDNNIFCVLSDYKNSSFYEYVLYQKELQKQEEMRLLYVAITRAKNCITIITTKEKETKSVEDKYNNWGKILKFINNS